MKDIFLYCYALYYQLFLPLRPAKPTQYVMHLSLSHYSELLPIRPIRVKRTRRSQPAVGIATTLAIKVISSHISAGRSGRLAVNCPLCLFSASDDACDAGLNREGPMGISESRLSSNLFPCHCTAEYASTTVNRGFVKLSLRYARTPEELLQSHPCGRVMWFCQDIGKSKSAPSQMFFKYVCILQLCFDLKLFSSIIAAM